MMRWIRHRRTRPQHSPAALRDAWQCVSLLLEYPGEDFAERVDAVDRALSDVPARVAEALREFLVGIDGVSLRDLRAEYVDTFDVTRKCCLHLTYYTHGDTRRRGVALIEIKQAYRHAGVQLDDSDAELPDFLPVLLEFGAFADPEGAWKLLNDYRVGIELLRLALQRRNSRWLPVITALRVTLPELNGDDQEVLAELIAAGPPSEDVGLDTSPYSIHPRLNPKPEPYDLGSTIPVGAPR
ncbi:MAG: nitrate reductase molybdenum cofactor assembly chaperone [Cumulibacter sp.]